MGCFALIFGVLAGLLIPPALGNLAATDELGAAFRFGEVFGLLRAAIGPYLMSIVAVFVAALVLSPIGGLICGIGALATSAYLQVVSGHLYGQAYKVAKANTAA
jgi:phosphotransferase system  glucose/maltose/N-acetylglucosamine-specific IIC component